MWKRGLGGAEELHAVTRLRGFAYIMRSGGWKDYNGVERFCKHYIEVGMRSSCMHYNSWTLIICVLPSFRKFVA